MASSGEKAEAKPADTVEWDVDMEIQLFFAMANHKPVGINKHFQMVCIWEKLSNSITREITTQDIWKHLESLYDLAVLDDMEPIPFPNHEVPFSLPEDEFGSLMKQKSKDSGLSDDAEVTSLTRKDRQPKSRKDSSSSHASTDSCVETKSEASSRIRTIVTSLIRKDRQPKSRKDSSSSHASTDSCVETKSEASSRIRTIVTSLTRKDRQPKSRKDSSSSHASTDSCVETKSEASSRIRTVVTPVTCKDSQPKSRKKSGSSHASTDTPSIKSD